MQIRDFHIGRADKAEPPSVDVLEAGAIWEELVARYDIIQLTQLLQNFIHDTDLRYIMSRGLFAVLEKQVNVLENEMNRLQIPLPERPPKSVNTPSTSGIFQDEFIFTLVFVGIQHMLDRHVSHIRSITTSDRLRKIFIDFMREELEICDKMVKYGKLKGWLRVPPKFTP
ncbi:MAG: DUF3231 family protein [Desulfotomaculales bacterium]